MLFLHQQTFAPKKIRRDKKNQLVHSYIYKESRYEKLKSASGRWKTAKAQEELSRCYQVAICDETHRLVSAQFFR